MLKEAYMEHVQKREEKGRNDPLKERIWLHQTRRYVEPFCIFGNLYYAGDDWVCAHIVDTGDGLLLFDAGNCGGDGKAMLLYSICKMGFKLEDIRWCVLSHAHIDHIGCASFLQQMFGTKLYISDLDAKMMTEYPERVFLQDGTDVADCIFKPDYCILDGETIGFGKTEVRFEIVSGHTPGTLAAFFDVEDGKEKQRVGYFGGYGFNTMKKEYLIEIGDSAFKMRSEFLDSIDKVIDEKVDIFMANHTDNGTYLEKMKLRIEGKEKNPFINQKTWREYLTEKKIEMQRFMKDSVNN